MSLFFSLVLIKLKHGRAEISVVPISVMNVIIPIIGACGIVLTVADLIQMYVKQRKTVFFQNGLNGQISKMPVSIGDSFAAMR